MPPPSGMVRCEDLKRWGSHFPTLIHGMKKFGVRDSMLVRNQAAQQTKEGPGPFAARVDRSKI